MKDILVFFRAVDQRQLSDPGPQLQKVLDFRKCLERDKTLLFHTYDEVESFTRVLRRHLARWIRDHEGGGPPPGGTPVVPPGLVAGGGEAPPAETEKLTRVASDPKVRKAIEEAWRLADDGQLTEAETKFAQLVVSETDADALNAYGRFLRRVGRLGQAEVMHLQALKTSAALGQDKAMADAYRNLGLIHQVRRELDDAEEMQKKALAVAEALGEKEGMANDYANLGLIYYARGKLDKAEEMQKKALVIEEAGGHKGGMANDYANLGLIYQARGDIGAARQSWKSALVLFRDAGMEADAQRTQELLDGFDTGTVGKNSSKRAKKPSGKRRGQ